MVLAGKVDTWPCVKMSKAELLPTGLEGLVTVPRRPINSGAAMPGDMWVCASQGIVPEELSWRFYLIAPEWVELFQEEGMHRADWAGVSKDLDCEERFSVAGTV